MDKAISDTIANKRLPLEIQVGSDDFNHGGWIPAVHTCDGFSISPHLAWRDIPDETESFVILMEDLDGRAGSQTHWLLFDYPGDLDEIPQGSRGIGVPGVNDFGNDIYRGPCPPRGEIHHYEFKLYALDEQLGWPRGSRRDEIEEAMIGHVVGYSRIIGMYER
jgi:hypothetical protein